MRAAILALLLSGCTTYSYINAEHPEPGAGSLAAMLKQCPIEGTEAEAQLAGNWLLKSIPVPYNAGPVEYVCDEQCWEARRQHLECRAEHGWIRCDKEASWTCERRPS